MSVSTPTLPPPHLIIPFASCGAEGWRAAMKTLTPEKLRPLARLLQGMVTVHSDSQDATSLSPPHERALARAMTLASDDTPDGLIPWAAHDAASHLPALHGKAWAWVTPCHWAMGRLHATLSDPAALALSETESRALLALMQPYFETDGITLHFMTPGRWLAEGELFRQLPTASLDRVMARNVDAWLPEAKDSALNAASAQAIAAAKTMRRLQNEMQMLLYTNPFNDARNDARQLPVNSFWLSGTGVLPEGYRPTALTAIAPRTLASAVFKEDWLGYAQAWEALALGEIEALLTRQRAGEAVRLTLCGDQTAQTFATGRKNLAVKISQFFAPPSLLGLLAQL